MEAIHAFWNCPYGYGYGYGCGDYAYDGYAPAVYSYGYARDDAGTRSIDDEVRRDRLSDQNIPPRGRATVPSPKPFRSGL